MSLSSRWWSVPRWVGALGEGTGPGLEQRAARQWEHQHEKNRAQGRRSALSIHEQPLTGPPTSPPSSLARYQPSLAGASSVGKSSLLLRFTDETFLSPDETSGACRLASRPRLASLEGDVLLLVHELMHVARIVRSHHRRRLQSQGHGAQEQAVEAVDLGASSRSHSSPKFRSMDEPLVGLACTRKCS